MAFMTSGPVLVEVVAAVQVEEPGGGEGVRPAIQNVIASTCAPPGAWGVATRWRSR